MKTKTRTRSTETTRPTAFPQLDFALNQSRSLFDLLNSRTFPEFQTVAQFDPATVQGLDLTQQRALAGSPVVDAAQAATTGIAGNGFLGPAGDFIRSLAGGGAPNAAAQFLLPTAQGQFLDFQNNPFFQNGVSAINDSVGSVFERAGRTGSGANQASLARGVGEFGANVFQNERANQLGAANSLAGIFNQDVQNSFGAANLLGQNAATQLDASRLAPTLANQDFIDLQNLLNVGSARQNQEQINIQDALARFNFPFDNAIQAQNQLNTSAALLGPLLGGTRMSDSTQTQSSGIGSQILGGLLTAGSLLGTGGLGGIFGAAGGAAGGAASGGGFTSGTFRLPGLAGIG